MDQVSAQEVEAVMLKHVGVSSLMEHLATRRNKLSKGVDRIDADFFEKNAGQVLPRVSAKLIDGSFRFSPYLEKLVSKGRARAPRVIAKPTIRDKLVLWAIKEVLHELLPSMVPRSLPNQVVRELVLALAARPGSMILRFDIESFYDRIDRPHLFAMLKFHIGETPLLKLLHSSINSPIVPAAYRRTELSGFDAGVGVPQGLPISNFLAHVYLRDVDSKLSAQQVAYFRYVDDILLLVPADEVESLSAMVRSSLSEIHLKANESKSKTFEFSQEFEFLGYEIKDGLVRPKKSSVDKYLRSIAGLFSCLRKRVLPRRGQFIQWSDVDFAELFIDELNELITGAISGGKQYGWVFYFNESNDLKPFVLVDSVVRRFARRTDLLTNSQRHRIKRCVRSIFETRHSKMAGYVKNYDEIVTLADKVAFLESYGYLGRGAKIGATEIEALYETTREARLARLERDVGLIS
ncbi:reverse transcriptase domain-containing protein [Stenotrophomonas sp. TWI1183]|uniref:reverse transcriptase domain-containing protein n=1 Tax=Stenotrophomonas sp. TWI1183 TaxID=3136799 RepID=UPI0032087796